MNLLQNPSYYYSRLLENAAIADSRQLFRSAFALIRDVFIEVVRDESMSFSSHMARSVYCFQKYAISTEMMQELQGFAVLDKRFRSTEMPVQAEQIKAALCISARLISYFSGASIPDEIEKIYEGRQIISLAQKEELPGELEYLQAIVLKITSTGKLENGIDYVQLICLDQQSGRKIHLLLSDIPIKSNANNGQQRTSANFVGGHLCKIGRVLWPYARVNFMNLQRVGEESTYFRSTERSMMVIEPDYLVDATTIAGCFQYDMALSCVVANPLLYLLGSFDPGESTEAMLLGTMANDFLDRLLDNPDVDENKVFWDVLMKHALTAVMLGKEKMAFIREQVTGVHYPNLKEVARHYRRQKTWIEPTFLSAKFGLQGRLDVLVEDPKDEMHKDIFELKSGKPPKADVWESHKMQVVCYNLLLSSTYEKQRKGRSAIFYSYLSTNSLRATKATLLSAQNVLMLRNLLVLVNRRMQKGDFGALARINLRQFGTFPVFLKDRIQRFQQVYAQASPLALSYFKTFASFVHRERQSAKTGTEDPMKNQYGFSSLWRMSIKEKVDAHKVLQRLRFNAELSEKLPEGLIQFEREEEEISDYRKGDIVLFYPQDEEQLRPLNYQIVKATIVEVSNSIVVLKLRNVQLSFDHFNKYQSWIIEHDFMESSFRILTQNLYDFLAAPELMQSLVLGTEKPSAQKLSLEVSQLGTEDFLTEDQKYHLKRALQSKDYYLLQGPPGTGKTSAIILKMVQQYLKQTQQVITLLAFTNRAVDEIADKLQRHDIDYIRLGGSDNADKRILSSLIQGKKLDEISDLLKKNRVFISTVSSFLSRKPTLKHITSFDLLIVDEASQLLEPHLVGILPAFKKFVLIGDQNQLPAVCSLKEALCQTEEEALNTIGICDLRVSLFERLFLRARKQGWDHAYGTLKHHFRMHEEIATLINHYYDNKLVSFTARQKSDLKIDQSPQVLSPFTSQILQGPRLAFVEVSQQGFFKSCPAEAALVAEIVKEVYRLYGEEFDQHKIGVMTPWRAQISEIKKAIADQKLLELVTVDTIERYQGSEKDIVILSTAIYDSSQLKMLQSLSAGGKVDRKLNVAISRAKERLIILGNPAKLQDPHYRRLIEQMQKTGQYIKASDFALREWESITVRF